MADTLFWLYLINSVLLINHEIDSAYWKEWNLFRLPGGIKGFLMIHIPLVFAILYGLILVYQSTFAGLILSLLISLGGIFAFCIHLFFIRKGRAEFRTPISLFILISILAVSIAQLALTLISLT
ncbi:MAG: hypothetical protein MUF61_01560 [archaeon]|jgi:hypothetical protein|nr:hypothetical protein [archaeon]